ncbi:MULTISPECIES: HupE/UreJ family protein [Mesorhizobium]|uniref:Protein hupE n=1 Tax=Mesorhizobium denitrificans TaxID=2294114 RepID=A0A371XGB7_9HYPH|nr:MULTISPECIES: HupE/UreJ family protein [Mesorhizobium]RFC68269.1 protein hupE [Mesorhizobium denitrificans]
MKRFAILLAALTLSTPAFAHLTPAEHGSLAAGFSHPLFGADHVLTMVGVGLWASLLGGRALWAIPAAFVVTMVLGFATSFTPIALPFVEPTIAASVVVLGLLALVALQVPTIVGVVVVGFFAFFHGYAHGGELGAAGAMPFMVGFAIATATLHGLGASFGLLTGRSGRVATRMAGALTTLGGLWLVAGA